MHDRASNLIHPDWRGFLEPFTFAQDTPDLSTVPPMTTTSVDGEIATAPPLPGSIERNRGFAELEIEQLTP